MACFDPLPRSTAAPRGRALQRWCAADHTAAIRLLAFPWCGAGASVYRRLFECLPRGMDAVAWQLPGRENRYREAPYRHMSTLVAAVLDEMGPPDDVPLVLFGHSMGAVVAHEVAHGLRQRHGCEPALLVVSGHEAPVGRQHQGATLHDADERSLLMKLAALGGTPAQLLSDAAAMHALLPVVRADYEVLETYACPVRRPLQLPVVACAGAQDPFVSPMGLQAWEGLSRAPLKTHWFEGQHFYLRDDPRPLAQALLAWVRELVGSDLGEGAP